MGVSIKKCGIDCCTCVCLIITSIYNFNFYSAAYAAEKAQEKEERRKKKPDKKKSGNVSVKHFDITQTLSLVERIISILYY